MDHGLSARQAHCLLGLAAILRMAYRGDSLEALARCLLDRINRKSNDAAALLDLSVIMQLDDQPLFAMELQRAALERQQLYTPSSNPNQPGLRVLVMLGPGEIMDNAPLELLLEDSDISLELMYVGSGIPPVLGIPVHDVAIVAVCESDKNSALLRSLSAVMKYWPQPFINAPSSIAQLSRPCVSELLKECHGVVVSETHRYSREDLLFEASGKLDLPSIIRPVDSHAGKGLSKIDRADELPNYLANQSQDSFYVAPFVDFSSRDGLFRKYRITIVDGEPFAAHLAVSPRWMVHYLNADMLNNPFNRAEEAEFMRTFKRRWLPRHREALRAIDKRIDLDFYSIDCAELSDDRLLVFEVDSGAVVHALDDSEMFSYKTPHMESVFAAFRQVLYRKAFEVCRPAGGMSSRHAYCKAG